MEPSAREGLSVGARLLRGRGGKATAVPPLHCTWAAAQNNVCPCARPSRWRHEEARNKWEQLARSFRTCLAARSLQSAVGSRQFAVGSLQWAEHSPQC